MDKLHSWRLVGLMVLGALAPVLKAEAQPEEWTEVQWKAGETTRATLFYDASSLQRLPRAIIVSIKIDAPVGNTDRRHAWYKRMAYSCRTGSLATGFSGFLVGKPPLDGIRWELDGFNVRGWEDDPFEGRSKGLLAALKSKCREPARGRSGPTWFPVAISSDTALYMDLANVDANGDDRRVWTRRNEGTSKKIDGPQGALPWFQENESGAHTISRYRINCATSQITLLNYADYQAGSDRPKESREFAQPTPREPMPGTIGRAIVDFGCRI